MDHSVLDLGLVLYGNAIENPQEVIALIEDLDKRFLANEHGKSKTIVDAWKPWTYNDLFFNVQKFFPESKDVSDSDYYAKEMKEIADRLYPFLEKAFHHYSNIIYPFAANNIKGREKSIHLLKYGKGGHLPAHQDQGVSSRVLSSVMYLNSNYDGGDIEFINSGVRVKPDAGSIIFFPSNFLYVHEVHPITSGFRYAMPHWYHNVKDIVNSTGKE
jgi:Rps23 Pro-64 3,4-dihydroxylase Tpa1-like proline 4-hydroxylase